MRKTAKRDPTSVRIYSIDNKGTVSWDRSHHKDDVFILIIVANRT